MVIWNSKNRGQSKKTQGWTALKSGTGSLAVATYTFKEAVTPRPTLGGLGLGGGDGGGGLGGSGG